MSIQKEIPPCPNCDSAESVSEQTDAQADFECGECEETFNTPIQFLTDRVSIGNHTTHPIRLHIPEKDSDDPICRMASQGKFKTRSAESYPLYYHDMCGYCRNLISDTIGR